MQVRQRIERACRAAGRLPESVCLIAVGKAQPVEALEQAAAAGQRQFGENYLQEALARRPLLTRTDLIWHFIGSVQSNKTQDLAAHFDWVHGVDRLKIAQRLSAQRAGHLPPLNICVQVNISDEKSKAGIRPAETEALCRDIARLPRLALRGLMAIPAPHDADAFRRMGKLHEHLCGQGLMLDTLSMGMTEDFEHAIANGATLVRVGTAIFGTRTV